MKVSREQAAENRERILNVAAKLFRERGFDGIGVADLMKGAGLTHGGFYGQFASKEDLMAQACTRAFSDSLDIWNQLASRAPNSPESQLRAITTAYLSCDHRNQPGRGCALAALGADISRRGPSVRQTVTEGVRAFVEALALLIPGKYKADKREKALATISSMVGALVLARAVDDEALSEEILRAVSASIS